MLYTLKFSGEDDIKHYDETYAGAQKWGNRYAKILSRSSNDPVILKGVEPRLDCSQVTPHQIYSLPEIPTRWPVDIELSITLQFINNCTLGMDTIHESTECYDATKIVADGRLHVETKIQQFQDDDPYPSTSIYVIQFDAVRIGFMIVSGEFEDAYLTELEKALELVKYLQSLFKNVYAASPVCTGLHEGIPNLRDRLVSLGVQL